MKFPLTQLGHPYTKVHPMPFDKKAKPTLEIKYPTEIKGNQVQFKLPIGVYFGALQIPAEPHDWHFDYPKGMALFL